MKVAGDSHLRPPHVRTGDYPRVPLPLTVVWEADPPPGVAPPEWLLLTNQPATTPEQIRQVGEYYACRWQIEEYHKVPKTGLRIEGCQFQSGRKVQAWLAVLSVVAVLLLNLRLAARDAALATQPATAVPASWVAILPRLRVRPGPLVTVRDVFAHLSWLGGYTKDNPDRDPPGWQTVWRGWLRFQAILQYELSTPKT